MNDNLADGIETSGASLTPHAPSLPAWDTIGLKRHFNKRYNRDSKCFKNILRIPMITKDLYQKISISILDKGLLYWTALAKFEGETEYTKKICIVDTNYFMTALDGDKKRIHSCYHVHPQSRYECKIRSNNKGSLKLLLESWVEGLQESGRYKDIPNIKNYYGL